MRGFGGVCTATSRGDEDSGYNKGRASCDQAIGSELGVGFCQVVRKGGYHE